MIYGRFSSLGNFKKPIILWLTSVSCARIWRQANLTTPSQTAGADIVIAVVLAWHLIRSRTGFRKTDARTSTGCAFFEWLLITSL